MSLVFFLQREERFTSSRSFDCARACGFESSRISLASGMCECADDMHARIPDEKTGISNRVTPHDILKTGEA